MRFVHLHVHSNYSFCRGASRLEELVVAARQRGMDTIALTDTNGLHGLIWFLDAAKAADLRPIVGAEIDLRAIAQRADFPVEAAGDPWAVPGAACGEGTKPPSQTRSAERPGATSKHLSDARGIGPVPASAKRRGAAGEVGPEPAGSERRGAAGDVGPEPAGSERRGAAGDVGPEPAGSERRGATKGIAPAPVGSEHPEGGVVVGAGFASAAGKQEQGRGPGERRLEDLRAWGRAVVLVKNGEGYAALCRLLSSLHHGGDWPPAEDPDQERKAALQRGVVERVAGYLLRGDRAGERREDGSGGTEARPLGRGESRGTGSLAGTAELGETGSGETEPHIVKRCETGGPENLGGEHGAGEEEARPLGRGESRGTGSLAGAAELGETGSDETGVRPVARCETSGRRGDGNAGDLAEAEEHPMERSETGSHGSPMCESFRKQAQDDEGLGSEHRKGSGDRTSAAAKRLRPPLTRAWLAEALAGLRGCIILSADAGLLQRVAALRSAQNPQCASADLYVELRPGVARGALLRFSRASGIPPVATGGVTFVDPSDYSLHRLLRAIDLNTCLSRLPPEELAPPDAVLASPGAMASRHPDCPEAVENTARIADLCRFTLPRGTPIFPAYESLEEPALEASPEPDVDSPEPDADSHGPATGLHEAATDSPAPDADSHGPAAGLHEAATDSPTPDADSAPPVADWREAAADSVESIIDSRERRERTGGRDLAAGTKPPSRRSEPPIAESAAAEQRDDGLLSPDALLERDCFEGAQRRYGEMNEAIAERLEYELSIVRRKRFAPYFLVVRDIVARAPRTCGRGSAAASLVSYALGITHVDPIRFDLFFERFLNPGRVDPPDIDVDFPWDERDDVLEWTFRRYGRRRTAMVSNHVTFQARAAVREIAKVFGLTDDEIGRVTKRMPWFTGDVVETTRTHPMFKDLSFPRPWPEILRLARRIDGYPRGLSVHCGGVVIVPGSIDRHVPVQPSAKGVDVVQWEKDQCEDAGLVKIDLLGNRSLAVIRDACRAVQDNGGPEIRFESFCPIDDAAAQDLVRRGDTLGVFYVESPAMRQLQAKCQVGDFEHLVIHSSIIRPAANEYIREYVRRLRGERWEPLHPLMGELLRETYGIMVYQEDVAKIAIAMAGFDPASADGLRKILSKKNKEERLRDYRERFFRGAVIRGTDEAIVAQVWDMILSFAGYSFCKPHSASYALVSFKSAYLRAHHPAEFMAAVISNGGGYYSTFAYISECRRMGLRVLPPDINESRREYTGRGKEVRVGLMQLKDFPDAGIDLILDERERGGRFVSFEDFLRRCGDRLGPAAVRILIRAGALDSMLAAARQPGRIGARIGGGPASGEAAGEATGETGGRLSSPAHRGDLFWRLAAWERGRGRKGQVGTLPLLPPQEPGPLPRAGPYNERTALEQEIGALGFLISRHPLSLFARQMGAVGAVRGCDLAKHVGKVVRVVGWYVTGKTVQTRRGEPMEFLSFEDTTALYETTFFPRTYARFCHMMSKVRPYLLVGRVEEDFGAMSLNVSEVRFLDAGARVGQEVPAVAPHRGGTSPSSEAWKRR